MKLKKRKNTAVFEKYFIRPPPSSLNILEIKTVKSRGLGPSQGDLGRLETALFSVNLIASIFLKLKHKM